MHESAAVFSQAAGENKVNIQPYCFLNHQVIYMYFQVYILTVHSQVKAGTGEADIIARTTVILCSIILLQAADYQDGLDKSYPILVHQFL